MYLHSYDFEQLQFACVKTQTPMFISIITVYVRDMLTELM